MTYLLITCYLAAAAGANLAISALGPRWMAAIAFLAIGADMAARDALHSRWEGRAIALRMGGLILTAALLTWIVNHEAIHVARASAAAFAVSGVLDALTYALLRDRAQLLRANGSNVLSALADSAIFPALAFGAADPWTIGAQWSAKIAGGFAWSLILTRTKDVFDRRVR